MADELELFTWWLPPDPAANRFKRVRSRWKMTREQASHYPGAECIESTREVRTDLRGQGAGVGGGTEPTNDKTAAAGTGVPPRRFR